MTPTYLHAPSFNNFEMLLQIFSRHVYRALPILCARYLSRNHIASIQATKLRRVLVLPKLRLQGAAKLSVLPFRILSILMAPASGSYSRLVLAENSPCHRMMYAKQGLRNLRNCSPKCDVTFWRRPGLIVAKERTHCREATGDLRINACLIAGNAALWRTGQPTVHTPHLHLIERSSYQFQRPVASLGDGMLRTQDAYK